MRHRDYGLGLPLLFPVWMFATPVVYPLTAVPPRLRSIYVLNPMVGIIENFRRTLLQGAPLDNRSLAIAAAVSVILFPISYVYFKHVEATIADVI